jgi:decaprenylphospho-beta-D-ribofuranose 2-oxidase
MRHRSDGLGARAWSEASEPGPARRMQTAQHVANGCIPELSLASVSGWGRVRPAPALLARPTSAEEVATLFDHARRTGRRVVPRGLGRSYGDVAQVRDGIVLDMRRLAWIGPLDTASGRIEAAGGASLDALMRQVVPLGWFPAVTPGTRHVTIGGAIAADVHGKNHDVDGTFAMHVERLVLQAPAGTLEAAASEAPGALPRSSDASSIDPTAAFRATAGGLGLTGVVLAATLRLVPIETAWMLVDTERHDDLDALMASMAAGNERYRYSVAWVDATARGKHLGRGVLSRANHAPLDALGRRLRHRALEFSPRAIPGPCFEAPSWLLSGPTMRACNDLWFHRAPRRRTDQFEHAASFFHPLDAIANWNRLYGPRGFLQYQFAVPFGAEGVVKAALEALAKVGTWSFLSVLKCFGPGRAGLLSFPLEGWTLALDVPADADGLPMVLDQLDEQVAAAGGRVYFAKDARLRPDLLDAMYPELDQWRVLRRSLDPEGLLCSDLSRRLGL